MKNTRDATRPWTPKRLREHLGFSQHDWARVLNVDLKTVRRWEDEANEPRGMAAEVFRGLACALDAGVRPADIHNRLNLGLGALIATSYDATTS